MSSLSAGVFADSVFSTKGDVASLFSEESSMQASDDVAVAINDSDIFLIYDKTQKPIPSMANVNVKTKKRLHNSR